MLGVQCQFPRAATIEETDARSSLVVSRLLIAGRHFATEPLANLSVRCSKADVLLV